MSSKLLGQVWDYQLTKAEQSVMLAMADHAKEDGTDCYPSVERIAWKTDYSDRQVRRVIKDLTRRGVLVFVRGGKRGRGNEYRIDLSKAELKPTFESRFEVETSGYAVDLGTPKTAEIPQSPDIVSSQVDSKRPDMVSGEHESPDMVSPQPNTLGGHFGANALTFDAQRGDIAMSTKPLTLNRERVDHSDAVDWSVCVSELCSEHPRFADWLPGSTLSATESQRDGKPIYRLNVIDPRGIEWLEATSMGIRRKLGSVLGHPVVVEIVAAEPEPTP